MTSEPSREPGRDASTDAPNRPLRVLQVGPHQSNATSRGGIATVMSLIMRHPGVGVVQEHAVTYDDGSVPHRARLFSTGICRVAQRSFRHRVDVVHVHMSFKGSVVRKGLALRVARAAGVPTVLHAHSHGFTRWYSGLPRYQQVAVRTLLRPDRWIVLGARWAGEYPKHLGIDPARVSVLHNPTVAKPDPQGTTWGWPASETGERPVRFAFLGRLGERKGCYDLVEALALLTPEVRSRIHIVMAGDGDVDGVRRAAEAVGLKDVVEFPGWIDQNTRAALLDTADVLLLPSHQEGLPMAVLEGMAAGLAVLTTPVGGIPDVLDDDINALLVPPGQPPLLADALARLATDPELRRRLGEAALATSVEYDVSKWYVRLEQIWREVAAGR